MLSKLHRTVICSHNPAVLGLLSKRMRGGSDLCSDKRGDSIYSACDACNLEETRKDIKEHFFPIFFSVLFNKRTQIVPTKVSRIILAVFSRFEITSANVN